MKKEKIDDNQLTFFDVIDGGKHEEDKKNIMKFKKEPHFLRFLLFSILLSL